MNNSGIDILIKFYLIKYEEGINNKINALSCVAYGYRNFSNYKSRILLHFNMKPKVDKIKV